MFAPSSTWPIALGPDDGLYALTWADLFEYSTSSRMWCVRVYGMRKPRRANVAYAGVSLAGDGASMSAANPAAPSRRPSATMRARIAASGS